MAKNSLYQRQNQYAAGIRSFPIIAYHLPGDSSMIIRDSADSPHERVPGRSLLCELLHPDKVAGAQELECSIAHAIIPLGESTLPHLLKKSTELYYILEGSGEMHIDKETTPVTPGQIILIPAHARQWIGNTGKDNLVFFCIVSPKWKAASEKLVA
jgi:mannose-6-phosphate isomerase-like protein (cupin superfamily)